jgi:hypothetical protein
MAGLFWRSGLKFGGWTASDADGLGLLRTEGCSIVLLIER